MNQRLSTFDFRLLGRLRPRRESTDSASRGFTLVELLVTLAIFAAMTGVVLANYRSFNNNGLLANASEDVVLALRQAQVYGSAARGSAGCEGVTIFDCPYGVYFSQGANSIFLFADANKDHAYTVADTIVQTISFGSNIVIQGTTCAPSLCVSGASVTFQRPNVDALIQPGSLDTVSIGIKDTKTLKSTTVTVTKAGQISFQ